MFLKRNINLLNQPEKNDADRAAIAICRAVNADSERNMDVSQPASKGEAPKIDHCFIEIKWRAREDSNSQPPDP